MPMRNSAKLYRIIADHPLQRLQLSTHRPLIQDPSARPAIKTETTTESTGVTTPKLANARRIQTVWYKSPQKPETTNSTNSRPNRLGFIESLPISSFESSCRSWKNLPDSCVYCQTIACPIACRAIQAYGLSNIKIEILDYYR